MNADMSEKEKAAMEAGIQYGMQLLKRLPKGERPALEGHITGVLIVFWGALWGSFGTEYARGFIESQLRGMEPDKQHEIYTEPTMQ